MEKSHNIFQSRTITAETPDIEIPNSNIWSYLYPRLQKFKKRLAVVCEKTNKSYTYEDTINGSLRWSKKLIHLYEGSAPPTVALLSSNIAEFPMILLGTVAAGSPICLITPSLTEENIAYMLKHSKASVIVVEKSLMTKFYNVQKMLNNKLKTFVVGTCSDGSENILDIIASGPVDMSAFYVGDPEDAGFLFFSSGTTGNPKAIIFTQTALLKGFDIMSKTYIFNMDRQDEIQQHMLTLMPITHAFACQLYCFVTFLLGDTLVVINNFDSDELIISTQKYQPKFLFTAAFGLESLTNLDNVEEILSNMKILAMAGCIQNKATIDELHKRVPHIIFADIYGATECNLISMTPLSNDPLELRLKLMPNIKLQIRDVISQEPLGPNKLGEIVLHTPSLMTGYLDNPEATSEVIETDGWYHTGDMGFYYEDHYITVVDRKNDIIVTSGKKVFPATIEDILNYHPQVEEVGVIGVPRLLEGQVPRAYVVLKDNGQKSVGEDDIVSYVNDRIKCVEERLEGGVRFVSSLPRTPMGKIQKKLLRLMDWSENDK